MERDDSVGWVETRPKPARGLPPALTLRAVVAVQVVWVAFSGALCRGLFPHPVTGWCENFVLPFTPLALFGFPMLMFLAARRARLPEWQRWVIAGIEAALTYAGSTPGNRDAGVTT